MGNAADEFETLYQRWRAYCETGAVGLMSSHEAYTDNPSFDAMVQMGEAALPYMMAKLQEDEHAHFLIHALERITNKRFTREEIDAAQLRHGTPLGNQGYAALWLDWWKQRPH